MLVIDVQIKRKELIMENLAKVDKLAEITGASFDEARMALRACHWETLDAMVYLEKLRVQKRKVKRMA